MFGDSVTLLLIKLWCWAQEIQATGVDVEVNLAEVVEPMNSRNVRQIIEENI